MSRFTLLFALLLGSPGLAATPTAPVDHLELSTSAGKLTITPVYHASTMLQLGGTTIWIDPWSKGKLDGRPKANVLLITDIHPDHLDKDAIAKVTDDRTVIIAPQAVADQIGRPVQHVLANGAEVTVGAFSFVAEPMYNLVRGPKPGQLFHDKGRGNGYLVKVGGKTVYFAGDTECTPEMKALTGIDVAFLPMNLPYTMPPEEAAACAVAFHPGLVVPYHYAGSDLNVFTSALQGKVPVTLAEFYPGGLPW